MPKNPARVVLDDYFVVQEILAKKRTEEGVLYLVKWANYPDPKDFTWEPKEHLETVKKMLEEFEAKERNWQRKHKQTMNASSNPQEKVDLQHEASKSESRTFRSKEKSKRQKAEGSKESSKKSNDPDIEKSKKRFRKTGQINSEQEQSREKSQKKVKRTRPTQEHPPIPLPPFQLNRQLQLKIGQGNKLGRFNFAVVRNENVMIDVSIVNQQNLLLRTILLSIDQLTESHNKQVVEFLSKYIQQMQQH